MPELQVLIAPANAQVGVCLVGPDHRVVSANEEWLRSTGFALDAVLGHDILTLFPESQELIAKLHARAGIGQSVEVLHNANGPDGRTTWWEWSAALLPMAGGMGTIILARDASDQVRREHERETQVPTLPESSGELFRRAILYAPLPILVHAEDGEIILASRVLAEMTGYTIGDISTVGEWIDTVFGNQAEAVRGRLANTCAIETLIHGGEQEIPTASGETRLWDFTSAPLGKLPDGRRTIISVAIDLTERKRAEESLRRSEESYRQLFEMESDALFLINNQSGEIVQVNAAAASMYGYTREEMLSLKNTDLSAEPEKTRQAMREHSTRLSVRWHRRKDGSSFPVEITVSHLIWRGEEYHIAAIRDITERRSMEDMLRASEARYRSLYDAVSGGVMALDGQGLITEVNDAACDMLGHIRDQLLGRNPLELHLRPHSEDGSPLPNDTRPAIAALRSGQPVRDMVMGIYHPETGNHRWLVVNSEPVVAQSAGVPEAVVTTITDITEYKLTEETLAAAETQKSLVLDTLVQRVIYLDRNLKVMWANRAAAVAAGHPARQLLGRRCHEVWQGLGEPCGACPVILALDSREPASGEVTFPDGTVQVVRASPVLDDMGIPGSVVVTLLDITERKMAESGLRETAAKLQKALEGTIHAMATVSESRDPYTAGHQRHVAKLAEAMAREMGLSEEDVEAVRMAGLVHDIGKISVPSEILSKPGKLNDLEFSLIKGHSETGFEILKGIEFSQPIAAMVLQHHERLDGSGYPFGLTGDAILSGAKILSVADVVEAMASHRPYRPALGMDMAMEEISLGRGVIYDPAAVDACIRLCAGGGFSFV